MEFKKKSINALGRNKYGDYIGYRRPKTTACEDGVWVLRDVRLIYSDDYTELRANGSNYAQIQGSMVFIVDEDFTADTRTVIMTPKTPDNLHSVYYKFDGDKIYWNDDDFGTTVVNAAIYNNLYGAFNGVDYTGRTVTIHTANNAMTSVSSEIDYFTTNHGATEVTVGSGETSIFFVAQATRTITFTTTKTLTETVTSLDSEGDGTLFLESNMGSAVGESVDISTNYSPSAITGWVVVYDDLDRTATSSVTVTQRGRDNYLTFDITSNGYIGWITSDASSAKTISYSLDNGSTWRDITATTSGESFRVYSGDTVIFKGENSSYNGNRFRTSSGAKFNAKGNIMSLIYGDNYDGKKTLTESHALDGIFAYTSIVNAGDLLLPATSLTSFCYQNMFIYCYNLQSAPSLPAAALAESCYQWMFYNCTSLTTVPALSATSLANNCCYGMFQGCTSLATVPVNMLPATSTMSGCYRFMFAGCTALTTAPDLLATSLIKKSCEGMFSGCTSLNYVKCLATDISATNCTYDWLAGVAATGTFEKAPNMSSWTSGASGIPTGWTVIGDNKVFVNFKEGTFLSNTINEYELEWSIFEGTIEDGTLLYSGVQDASEVPAYAGYVYSWGLDSSTGQEYSYEIPSSDYGTTKTYTYELAVLDYSTGTLYTVLTNTLTASIPSSPSGTVTIDVALPDLS